MTLEQAIELASMNATIYHEHKPTLGTLLAEVAEFAQAVEGKHEDHPSLELVQIAGIAINLLRRYDTSDFYNALEIRAARLERFP